MSYINDVFGRPMFEKQMNPQYEAYERLCKSIGDMAKENETLKERIRRLEDTGDDLMKLIPTELFCNPKLQRIENQWRKAKEAKP